MNRGERTALLLRAAGNEGMNTAEIGRKTGLIETRKAISDAKDWLNKTEMITSKWEKTTWFGFFPRKQKRYFITNTRS